MLASFPWYDLPSVQWANDALWHASGLPGELDHHSSAACLWYHDELLVSQACGLDLFLSSAPLVPIAAPVFELDCEPGHYYSYIVGDPEGKVAAVNSSSSRSGYSVLLSVCTPRDVLLTGSHVESLAAVRSGRAEVAAIDAVTWHILARDTPELIRGVEICTRSCSAPAPPYVIRQGTTADEVWSGLVRAYASSAATSARQALLLRDIVAVEKRDYLPVWAEYQHLRLDGHHL
ncbi:MAG: PhnD/SsuA/transferrin family substrate-binding protein [Pseudomonadales bacterium]